MRIAAVSHCSRLQSSLVTKVHYCGTQGCAVQVRSYKCVHSSNTNLHAIPAHYCSLLVYTGILFWHIYIHIHACMHACIHTCVTGAGPPLLRCKSSRMRTHAGYSGCRNSLYEYTHQHILCTRVHVTVLVCDFADTDTCRMCEHVLVRWYIIDIHAFIRRNQRRVSRCSSTRDAKDNASKASYNLYILQTNLHMMHSIQIRHDLSARDAFTQTCDTPSRPPRQLPRVSKSTILIRSLVS